MRLELTDRQIYLLKQSLKMTQGKAMELAMRGDLDPGLVEREYKAMLYIFDKVEEMRDLESKIKEIQHGILQKGNIGT